MQSVKVYLRRVGLENKDANIISADNLSLEIEYKFTSQGYLLQNSTWLEEVKNSNGDVIGRNMGFVFVKDVDEAKKK